MPGAPGEAATNPPGPLDRGDVTPVKAEGNQRERRRKRPPVVSDEESNRRGHRQEHANEHQRAVGPLSSPRADEQEEVDHRTQHRRSESDQARGIIVCHGTFFR